jgi:hypothetical protein
MFSMGCASEDTQLSSRYVAANCGPSRGVSDNLGDSHPIRMPPLSRMGSHARPPDQNPQRRTPMIDQI